MKLMQKIISAGFATCALASASLPALSWSVWPDVDFEWYANVGKPVAGATATIETFPAPREGQIWSPSHYERSASGSHVYVPGRWVALAGKKSDIMRRSQRVSNKAFRGATDWSPRYPSVHDGWPAVLAAAEREVAPHA